MNYIIETYITECFEMVHS